MISVGKPRATKSRVVLIPLKDPAFISLLREFKNLLKSSIGPKGNLKLLVTGGGYVQLSSSSSQLFRHYDQFSNPIIQIIAQTVMGSTDFGLYSGVIISSCMEQILSLQCSGKMTLRDCTLIFNFLYGSCNQIFDSRLLKIKLNFDSVTDFIPVIKSVIKPRFQELINDNFLSELAPLIVKSFLFTLDEEKFMFGKVSVQVFKGNNDCKFFPGIIYRLSEEDDWISAIVEKEFKSKAKIKTLLFTATLDYDCHSSSIDSGENNKLSAILRIMDEAIRLGVNVIACQKVVHRDIKFVLQRKSVIVLERMGSELSLNFQQLTSSFPISVIDKLKLSDISSMVGTLNRVNIVKTSSNYYFLMEHYSTNVPVATLLIHTSCLSGKQHIKVSHIFT